MAIPLRAFGKTGVQISALGLGKFAIFYRNHRSQRKEYGK
jgi:hypothetical protein